MKTMTGEIYIAAPREEVWAALNDPEILRRCIPGCSAVTKSSETDFQAAIEAKVGPLTATFEGALKLDDLKPPEGCSISAEGRGGAAGFAKGRAKVRLLDDGGTTRLVYAADAELGGKLAALAARLVDGTAKQLADGFFARFVAEVEAAAGDEDANPTEAGSETPVVAAQAADEVARDDGVPAALWVPGLLAIVLLLLAIFGLA